MQIKDFYDQETAAFSYVISDPKTGAAAIIDSVLNYDHFAARTSTKSADELIEYIESNKLKLEWILETHIHADHLSAADYIKNIALEKDWGKSVKTAIGARIVDVLKYWAPVFRLQNKIPLDGSQFDRLFHDGEKFKIGELEVEVIHTPGHTPSCYCYKIGDAIFVGDVIFMPDVGTARCDFPGGSVEESYNSLQKIFALGDDVKIYTAHDYPPQNRELACVSTVGDQKKNNILANEKISRGEFIEKRTKRDATLAVPKLLLPSIQVNICAARLPKAKDNGIAYLRLPLNKF